VAPVTAMRWSSPCAGDCGSAEALSRKLAQVLCFVRYQRRTKLWSTQSLEVESGAAETRWTPETIENRHWSLASMVWRSSAAECSPARVLRRAL